MVIPKQLKKSEFRFVLLGKWDKWKNRETEEVVEMTKDFYEEMKKTPEWQPLGKAPFEKAWQEKGYQYNDAKLIQHIKEGNNFGVIGGYGNLRILDIDDSDLGETLQKKLDTFTVITGGGGRHFYFISDYEKNHVLVNELGELRAKNYQVVSAPCKHPSENFYEVINDTKIKEISAEELKELIKPYIREKIDIEFKDRPKDTSGSGLEYRRVLALIREGKSKEDIFNEMNKYAKWATHGTKFPEYRELTYNNALEYHQANPLEEKKEIDEEEKIQILWDDDLDTFEIEEKNWIVEKLIPSRSVCVLTGKRGTMKTFIALQMAYSIASGEDFLGKFQTKQGGVLYLDKENGVPIMKGRKNLIKTGMDLKEKLKVGYICFSQLKIDKNTDVWKIEEEIINHKPTLFIVDTYRRGITFDENDAGAVSHLFVDVLRPLVEKYNISILLIHHDRKGRIGETTDEMDEIRGSSDLANYADIILKMERPKGGGLILKQLKNRGAMEEEPISIKAEFDDISVKMTYEGEFKKMSKAERCVEALCLWVEEKYLHQFSTKDAKEIAFKRGFKESTFKNALNEMQDAGLIISSGFGLYEVSKKLQKDGS